MHIYRDITKGMINLQNAGNLYNVLHFRSLFLTKDARNAKKAEAPWPGFGPGSSGRQPLILDRTILPGLCAECFKKTLTYLNLINQASPAFQTIAFIFEPY